MRFQTAWRVRDKIYHYVNTNNQSGKEHAQ